VQHLRAGGDLHDVVGAVAGDRRHPVPDVFSAAVDDVGGTEFAGEFEATGDDVDRDDLAGAHCPGGHHRGQSHRASAEHRYAGPRWHPQRVHHRPCPRLQAAPEGAGEFQGHLVVQFDHVPFRGHRVAGERRLAEEVVVDVLFSGAGVPVKGGGAVEAAAAEVQREDGIAVHRRAR
jgi:hypothetical protein